MQIEQMNQMQAAGPPPGGRPPGGGPIKAGMDAAAQTLGLSAEELKSALDGGRSLADLASAAGVSTEELKTSMTEAISSVAPAQVAERMAAGLDSVIAGERPPPPPRHQQDDVQSAVSVLAKMLDSSSEEILSSLEAGTLTELFEKAGVDTRSGILINTDM